MENAEILKANITMDHGTGQYRARLCARVSFLLILIVLIPFSPRLALCQSNDRGPQFIAGRSFHYANTIDVPTGATSQRLLVEIDDWTFPQGNTQVEIPAMGVTLMTIRSASGTVVLQTGQAREEHSTGDYWTVPAGAHLTVSTGTAYGGAVIRTIFIGPGS
jgi:hypothetical protein